MTSKLVDFTLFFTEVDIFRIVKMLLKIKDIPRNAVFNDTLALIQKWFNRADFNKFLMLLWNSEEIKNRELGPIGFSYTDGHHKFDYSSMKVKLTTLCYLISQLCLLQGSHNEITDINVKAIEVCFLFANFYIYFFLFFRRPGRWLLISKPLLMQ